MLSSLLLIGWISIGAFYYDVGAPFTLPTSVTNCSRTTSVTEFISTTNLLDVTSNNTFLTTINHDIDYNMNTTITNEPFIIYKLSFMYYPVLGTVVTVLIGLLVSYLTGPNNVNDIDNRLLIPYYRSNNYQCKPVVLNAIPDSDK